jgi:uncharacterized protein with HEPN domain
MKKEWGDYVADILNSLAEIDEFIRGMTYAAFIKDRRTVNAVIRSLEVMGEAAKRIPDEIRKKYPDIPWKQMTGMRDKLIHEYAGVDLETVWDVSTVELPPLRPFLEKLAKDIE